MDSSDLGLLRNILNVHAQQYPLMRPGDAVKLVFQNEFGGGHLALEPSAVLNRLRAEYASAAHHPSLPLFEEIGNGMVRIMLAALDEKEYPLETLSRDFIRSAALHSGSHPAFLEKLELLRALALEGLFRFSAGELESYLDTYIQSGCPPVSHSPEYRQAYHPAYRVMLRRVSFLLALCEIRRLLLQRPRLLVAIDGRCASGKTTLASRLHDAYGWSVVHMDHFFLRPEQRTCKRYETPGGNIDHERFLTEVLLPLRNGQFPQYQPFDCQTQQLAAPIQVTASPVTIIEGSYSCHPELWNNYDLRIFLTATQEEQMKRILVRNGPDHAEAFRHQWIPLEERYFTAYQLELRCDYCISLSDPLTHLQSALQHVPRPDNMR